MLLVLDRFEEGYAVCQDIETERIHHFEISKLPGSAKENDVLRYENGVLTVDATFTRERKKEIDTLMEELWD